MRNFKNARFIQYSTGIFTFVLGCLLLDRAVRAAEVGLSSRGAPAAAASSPSSQTLKPTEPPFRIGERFDTDEALPSRAPSVASYELVARLDPSTHRIDGRGTIRWTNRSARPARELYFHLYLNAFKNSRSLFFRSPFQGGRSGKRPEHWGYCDVLRLTSPRWGDLWKSAQFARPEGSDDETDVRVPLPEVVPPGGSLELAIEWKSQLPSVVERTGYAGGFHMAAQWYPKLARREPDGRWAHFNFHPHSEFYADFGTYDVTLDVPRDMVVGATGERVESRTEKGRKIVRHRAESVHDFAWSAWNRFTESSRRVGRVDVRVLAPPGHDKNAAVTLRAVESGLSFYGKLFGEYPYSVLTVVHPPQEASEAGGMEYPTLITTGGSWYAGYVSNLVERVTLHELAHQWFYGLIATDEHSWPFLDEGLTSYAESLAMRELFGTASGARLPGLAVEGDAYARMAASLVAHHGVVAQPAPAFANFRDIGGLVYARTTALLLTIERVFGRRGLEKALGRYARYYRYDHPSPRHLLAAVREVLGDEAARVLEAGLNEGGWIDFTAAELRAEPVTGPTGIFDSDGGRIEKSKHDDGPPERWLNQVLIYREGSLSLPVEVDLVFAGGKRVRKRWDGRGRWTTVTHEGSERAIAALVDPQLRVVLDEDLMNNATRVVPGASLRVLERSTYLAELWLGWLGP